MSKIFVHTGLEVHCQILTNTKMFSNCAINSIDRYTLAYPGTLPIVNKSAVKRAVKFAMSLNCKINLKSRFDRKHYFYYDLPKGYQITQNEIPLGENGYVTLSDDRDITVKRLHIEEDAGKSIRNDDEVKIDYKRAGIPLVEIVTPPEILTPEDASDFVKEIRNIAVLLGINNGNLQNGEIRCDANVSVSFDQDKLGAKVEIKNLNSFKYIRDAIKYEISRQSELLLRGEKIFESTRTYDESTKKTIETRKKETTADYRYLPEPDIPPLIIDENMIEKLSSEIPDLPAAIRKKLSEDYKMRSKDIEILIEDSKLLQYYFSFTKKEIHHLNTFNSLFFNNLRVVANKTSKFPKPEYFIYIYKEFAEKKIPKSKIDFILEKAIIENVHPNVIIINNNLRIINDEKQIHIWFDKAIKENPVKHKELISGNSKLNGFFIGQVIKMSDGLANPEIVQQIADRLLIENH